MKKACVSAMFPMPKKGKRWAFASVKKRLAGQLRDAPLYVRHGKATSKSRGERQNWCRTVNDTIKDLLTASDRDIVELLTKDGILQIWGGKQCPCCQVGRLGPLEHFEGRGWRYRCRAKACHRYVLPHQFHPVFMCKDGPTTVRLQDQAAALFCAIADVTQSAAHHLLGRNHKHIQGIYNRLDEARCKFVESEQKKIKYGADEPWADVEADQVDLRKWNTNPDAPADAKCHLGAVGRHRPERDPQTLYLTKLDPAKTKARAPGPGAMRKRDWKPIADRFLKNRRVVLHTDGARAYKMKIPGVIHDNVVHKKKKTLIKGKYVWVKPRYARVVKHPLLEGCELSVTVGTQVIDRAWRHIRSYLTGRVAKPGPKVLRQRIRSAQWAYWNRDQDLWLQTGNMFQALF